MAAFSPLPPPVRLLFLSTAVIEVECSKSV